jgi:catechol 2,3-dioxygenase-like lactoylglutathione lyase family enzyme
MLDFNHAMIYTADVGRALGFYRDQLGFEAIEVHSDYARLKSSGGATTIALHALEKSATFDGAQERTRLYFEAESLDDFCAALVAKGVVLEQMPKDMPWGWRHAYLRDPDGRQISLYSAGQKRLNKTS